MDLFSRKTELFHNNLMMRLGAVLVSISLVFSLFVQPPKAKAVAPLAAAALGASMIYGFMQAAGISFSVSAGASAEDMANALSPYIGQFEQKLKEDIGDASITFSKWLGYDDWDSLVADMKYQKDAQADMPVKYKLFIPKAMSAKLAEFTKWFAEKMGLAAGSKDVPLYHTDGGEYIPLADGGKIVFSSGSAIGTVLAEFSSPDDTVDKTYTLANGETLRLYTGIVNGMSFIYGEYKGVKSQATHVRMSDPLIIDKYTFTVRSGEIIPYVHMITTDVWVIPFPVANGATWLKGFTVTDVAAADAAATDISIAQADELAPAVDTVTELPTVITIPLGTDIADIADLLQKLLEGILAGDLAIEGAVAKAEEVAKPDEPAQDEELPDVEDLGLPALGAALVTRFPFSIPWDVVKSIKLIAAPAEAPYWEVDFLSPISSRVGGWKGDTKIVIDMGAYPIVGQLCRWTSMIGFCLALAAATKRLVWTA